MLVSIFRDGRGPDTAPLHLHFDRPPEAGDLVELDGRLLTVSKAWHRPDEACVGSKFAVMLKANDEAKAA